jgi:hypothetical protein
MFGAGFIANRRRDFLDEYRIPGRSHTDRLGKDRGAPIPCGAVQDLTPKVVGRDGRRSGKNDRMVTRVDEHDYHRDAA